METLFITIAFKPAYTHILMYVYINLHMNVCECMCVIGL